MPVARCCAAIPKQRDSLMLSYTLGFPHAERRPYAVIHARLPIQRDVLLLSCKLGFPIQRDVLMLSYKMGFPFREMSSCCHASWAAILTSHALQQGDMT